MKLLKSLIIILLILHVAILLGCRFHDLTSHDVVDNYEKIEHEIHELAEKKLKCYSLEYTHLDERHTTTVNLVDDGLISIEAMGCGKRAVFTTECSQRDDRWILCSEIQMEIID